MVQSHDGHDFQNLIPNYLMTQENDKHENMSGIVFSTYRMIFWTEDMNYFNRKDCDLKITIISSTI